MFQQQSQYQASGIGIAISGMIPQVVQAVCQQNSLDANIYNQLVATMQQNINQITQQIEGRYDVSNGLHTDVLYQELAAIASSILNESNVSKPLFQQPQANPMMNSMGQPVGFGGPNMMGAQGGFQQPQNVQFGHTGGFTPAGIGGNPNPINSATSFTGEPSAPARTVEEPSVPAEPVVEEHIHQLVDKAMVRSTDSLRQYECTAVPNIARYNKEVEFGDLIVVSEMLKIMDAGTGEVFNFSRVHNAIKEPSLQRLITNTVDQNPLIYKDNWISVIDGSIFDVKQFGTSHTDVIDTSSMKDQDLGYVDRVRAVLESIQEKPNNFVKAFEERLLARFNHHLKCYVRISTSRTFLSVSAMDDILELFDLKDPDLEELTNHITYPETVFKCFKNALDSLISDLTKTGFHDLKDVIYDMSSSDTFVIRDNGICERDPDIATNEKAMEKIKKKFTVLGQSCTVLVANFIPNTLDVDLHEAGTGGGGIIVDEVRSIVDHVVLNSLKHDTPIVVLKDGDRILTMGVTWTIDNVRSYFLME